MITSWRPEMRRLYRRVVQISCQRYSQGRSRACLKNVLGYMHKAPKKVFLNLPLNIRRPISALNEAISDTLSHIQPSRQHSQGRGGTGAVPEGIRFCSRSGSGFLSNSRHAGYLHVLYRDGPSDYGPVYVAKTMEEKKCREPSYISIREKTAG